MKSILLIMIFVLNNLIFSEGDFPKRVDWMRESKLNYQIGDSIQDFKVKSLDGKEKINLSSFKGKKVVVNFTTTWCPDCIREKLILNKEYEEVYSKREDIKFIIVFGPYVKDDKTIAMDYMRKNNFSFPAYYDSDKELSKIFGVKNIPVTFLIDEKGILEDVNIESGYKELKFFK